MVGVGVLVELVVVEVVQSDEFYELIWRFDGDNRGLELLLVRVKELLYVVSFARELVVFERFDEVAKVVGC